MLKSLLIHNPRCSKSREAKDILEKYSIQFDTIEYMKDGLKEKLLTHLPELLNLSYQDFVRANEDVYKELGLKGKNPSNEEWVTLLMEHPVLLERPIFIHNEKAVVGRPPERVLEIL